jgi:hypothetical protein
VHGYPVLGDGSALNQLLEARGIDLVVVSTRGLEPERMRDLRTACAANHVALTRLQVGLEDLIVPVDSGSGRLRKR